MTQVGALFLFPFCLGIAAPISYLVEWIERLILYSRSSVGVHTMVFGSDGPRFNTTVFIRWRKKQKIPLLQMLGCFL
ncbi:MAG: hypothetical protein WCE81_01650 [Halobacteriota archaeon]